MLLLRALRRLGLENLKWNAILTYRVLRSTLGAPAHGNCEIENLPTASSSPYYIINGHKPDAKSPSKVYWFSQGISYVYMRFDV
ncbi:hypothetical protein STEG23_032201 [Scotinomys teguina]